MRGMRHPEPSERLGWCCLELQYGIVLVCVAVLAKQRNHTRHARGGGGGYSWKFSAGVCRLVLYILTLFQTKKGHFP